MKEAKRLPRLISLRGKTAIITGAGAGMGAATAKRFCEAGACLWLLDVKEANLAKVKKDLSRATHSVDTYRIDLSSKSEIDRFWESIETVKPDILVNNAGIFPFRDFLDTDEEFVQKVMNINLNAVYWMCQHFIRVFLEGRRKKKGAAIVNVGSVEAILPFKKDLAHYTTGKAGVIALTRALARDYGRKGIRANVILPGGIVTTGTKESAKEILRMHFGVVSDGVKFMTRLPLARMGEPDEVARISLMLSSEMSSYVNGAVIPVDGGFLSA
jgi:NAD(P)-dependent dehydrogenase (short-subunit alcohol dehydrogenase family)